MATATRSRPKTNGRPKQGHLPSMEPPKLPKIERLADAYQDLRDQRMQLLDQEIAKRDLLFAAMKEEKLARYDLPDGRVVEIVADEKVRVRKAKPEGGEE